MCGKEFGITYRFLSVKNIAELIRDVLVVLGEKETQWLRQYRIAPLRNRIVT